MDDDNIDVYQDVAMAQDEVDYDMLTGTGEQELHTAAYIDRGRITNLTKYQTELGDKFKPKIQQMLACFDLGISVPLEAVTARVRIFEFTPERLVYGVLHLPKPTAKVRVTANGKCTILKVKTYDDAVKAAKKTCKLFRKIGYPAKVTSFRIANIVAVTDLKLPIRLMDLHKKHHHWCTYEPEIFPALRMNMLNPKCTLSIFVNGKVTIIGAKREASLSLAISRLFPIIRPFIGNADGSSEDLINKVLAGAVGETKEVENYKEDFDSEDEANYEAPAPVQNEMVPAPAAAAAATLAPTSITLDTPPTTPKLEATAIAEAEAEAEAEGGTGTSPIPDDLPFAGLDTDMFAVNDEEEDLGFD